MDLSSTAPVIVRYEIEIITRSRIRKMFRFLVSSMPIGDFFPCGQVYLASISAKLFCKRSQVTFIPYGIVLKDERPTSNIEHRTSNNDVAPLLKLFQHGMKKPMLNFE